MKKLLQKIKPQLSIYLVLAILIFVIIILMLVSILTNSKMILSHDLTGNIVNGVTQDDASEDIILIGAILPMTGPLSLVGQDISEGLTVAADEINKKNNGPKIKLILEDSQLDPKVGIAAYNKLRLAEVDYIIVSGTPVLNAIIPLSEKDGVVVSATSINNKIIENSNYIIRPFYGVDQATVMFEDYILSNNKQRVAVLYQDNELFFSQVKDLESKNILFISKDGFKSQETDFRTVLTKIQSKNPDLILVLGYGNNLAVIFKQAKEIGIDEKEYLGGLDFMDAPKDSRILFKNVVFVAPMYNNVDSEKNVVKKRFIDTYFNRYNRLPSHQAAYAYDSLLLMYYGAVESKNNTTRAINHIRSLGLYHGAIGEMEILQNGDTRSELAYYRFSENTQEIEFLKLN